MSRGGGGGVLNKVLYREALLRSPNPYTKYTIFFTERLPFYIATVEIMHLMTVFHNLFYTSAPETPTSFLYFQPEKATPFGRSISSIIGGTETLYGLQGSSDCVLSVLTLIVEQR